MTATRSGSHTVANPETSQTSHSEPLITFTKEIELSRHDQSREDVFKIERSDGFDVGRIVVWKKIPLHSDIDEIRRSELEKLKRLSHANIIRVVDFCSKNHELGLLLCPVTTSDLATVLNAQDQAIPSRNAKPAKEKEAASNSLKTLLGSLNRRHPVENAPFKVFCMRSLERISSAVEYLHSNNIRLKSFTAGNVLLGPENQLRLTDFWSPATPSNVMEHPLEADLTHASRYLAPEVVQNPPPDNDFSNEIFSLGCMFLEMVLLCDNMNFPTQKKSFRNKPDRRYHTNIDNIIGWLEDPTRQMDPDCYFLLTEIRRMLDKRPRFRPNATQVARTFNILITEANQEPDRLGALRTLSTPSEPLSTTLTYGNTYKARPDPNKPGTKGNNEQPFSLYVDCDNKVVEIEKMYFFLHPGWPDPQRVLTEPPFEVHSTCWGNNIFVKVAVFLKAPTYWKPLEGVVYRPCSEPIYLQKQLELGDGSKEGDQSKDKEINIWRKLS